ncbi:hypothetical protein [Inquilinus sp. CA228]|uniref:hypothetical protein n=1 Tax=Inquilinus sp. CA228 TaxID=3455609 RepID=UPI003F8D1552
MSAVIAPATIADLERAYDGRIPDGLLQLALRAPERVARICRTKVRGRIKAAAVRDAMTDKIVEIFEERGGEVAEHDLLACGFTPKDIRLHRHAAMRAARPRLRLDRSAA